jgi:hypothetical protein
MRVKERERESEREREKERERERKEEEDGFTQSSLIMILNKKPKWSHFFFFFATKIFLIRKNFFSSSNLDKLVDISNVSGTNGIKHFTVWSITYAMDKH